MVFFLLELGSCLRTQTVFTGSSREHFLLASGFFFASEQIEVKVTFILFELGVESVLIQLWAETTCEVC